MTKLLTIPKFSRETGLPYHLCLQLVQTGDIPSVQVGSRRRIDFAGWSSGYRQVATDLTLTPPLAAIGRRKF